MDCGTGGNIATVCQIDEPVKPIDGVHAELGRGAGGVLHLLGGPLPHALGLAVAPDPRRQDALVPLVDRVVADGLADEVVGDRPDLQPVLVEELAPALRRSRRPRPRPMDLEVVAPAGDLQPVVAPVAGQPADLLERQVGPLAGEQRERSWHRLRLLRAVSVRRARCGVLSLSTSASHCRRPDRSTASSTRCTCRPSANDGVGSVPAARSRTRSTTWWVKVCS